STPRRSAQYFYRTGKCNKRREKRSQSLPKLCRPGKNLEGRQAIAGVRLLFLNENEEQEGTSSSESVLEMGEGWENDAWRLENE
ncbi:hypothetical protein CU097_002074, partial [Rhizopus azygosporus]